MIEQHIYVKTDMGLKTHSKSKGISEEFIESIIKPSYSPIDLYYLESPSFPGQKCAFPLSGGGFLIGNGIRCKKEPYTYIHSFVTNSQDLHSLCKDPSFFISAPPKNILNHPVLPSLEGVSRDEDLFELPILLSRLDISIEEFYSIIFALFASAEQGRKVFIALKKAHGIKEISSLLFYLYSFLPYHIRQNTGYSTLFGETSIRQEINLYFLYPEKISYAKDFCFIDSYNAIRDYIFNLESHKHRNTSSLKNDMDGEFFSLLLSCLKEQDLSNFLSFAHDASFNIPYEKKLSLRFYDDLAYIYSINENLEGFTSKIGRITLIFTELLKSGAKNHTYTLYSDFIRIYRRFIKERSCPIPLDILRRFVINFDFVDEKLKDELYDILTLDIDLCMKNSENELVFTHIDALKSSFELYNKVIERKMLPSKSLVSRYFTYMAEQRKTIHAIMDFADTVYSDMPQITSNDILNNIIYEKALSLYDFSGDRFEALKYLESKCETLTSKYPCNKELFGSIYRYALENYMTSFSVNDISYAQIIKFPLLDAETISEECTLKHRIILAAKEILSLTDDLTMSFISYDAFGFENVRGSLSSDPALSKKAEATLKNLLLRCLNEKKDSPKRILYIILYYIYENKDGRIKNNFDSIYEFLDKTLNITPFEFIEWYLSSHLFMTPVTQNGRTVREANAQRADLSSLTAFYEATRKYFVNHGQMLTAKRDMKKFKKELDKVSLLHPDFRQLTSEFRKVLNDIIRDNYPPLKRVIDRLVSGKNFKFFLVVAVCFILVVAGIFIGGSVASKIKSDILPTKAYADSEILFSERLSWSSYKTTKNKDFVSAPYCIDGTETFETLDFSKDENLTIFLGTSLGIKIDGISVSSVLSDENSGFSVFVTDVKGKRFLLSVSDYDISSASSVYAFDKPVNIKTITIMPKDNNTEGSIQIKEIQAYIKK